MINHQRHDSLPHFPLSGGMIHDIHSIEELNEALSQAGNHLLVLGFHSTSCALCHRVMPTLDELSQEYHDVTFLKVNCEDTRDIVLQYNIGPVPTFLFFLQDTKVAEVTGDCTDKLRTTVAEFHGGDTRETEQRPTLPSATTASTETMDPTLSDFHQQLVSMGFPESRALKALEETGGKSVDQALEWIVHNEEEKEEETAAPTSDPHTSVSQEEQQQKLQEALLKVRHAREEKEKEDEKTRELQRREQGRAIQQLREKTEDYQRKKASEERRREALENKKARDRQRELIEQDKKERRAAQAAQAASVQSGSGPAPKPPPIPSQPVKRGTYDTVMLRVRLLDGTAITLRFSAKDTVESVEQRVAASLSTPDLHGFVLKVIPDMKELGPTCQHQTLEEIGLVPSGTLVVIRRGV